jgi:hypothetical protein
MCEFCTQSEVTAEKLDADEQHSCEWISEELGPGACHKPAAYAVSDWFVDDHLCETHKLAIEKDMKEGLDDFLDSVGFSAEFEIKSIEREETCDYVEPTATDWKPCGKKARYAKYILDTSLLCPEHAAEASHEAEKE